MTRITGLRAIDLRFPTSDELHGSDAMNPAPDYSAADKFMGWSSRAYGDAAAPELAGHVASQFNPYCQNMFY